MTLAIRTKRLGKQYQLGGAETRYETFREAMVGVVVAPFKRFRRLRGSTSDSETIWALKDISLDIDEGQVVGVIGRNGAGKSTLLKVLSRITAPTTGRVELRGRLASLLEVGTGFHPELTGRENIFLNGAILGMTRADVRRQLDAIVDFSGVSKFLETPVKRYSSGMYLRLAFSVSAHLDADILLVDEILAVGDVEFQKRCLGKIDEIGTSGRTILFVSHNLGSIRRTCERVIWLEAGRVKQDSSDVAALTQAYLSDFGANKDTAVWEDHKHALRKNSWFEARTMYLVDQNGQRLKGNIRRDGQAFVVIEGEISELDDALQVGYALYSSEGGLLFWSTHTDGVQADWPKLKLGRNALMSELPLAILNEGNYRVELLVRLHNRQWLVQPEKNAPAISFAIDGTFCQSPYWANKRPGAIAPNQSWIRIDSP